MESTMNESSIREARAIIARCESALRRRLSDGERRDLLADNTSWTLDDIAAVVAQIARR